MGEGGGVAVTEDKAAILLGFEDGSFGTIHYLANGAASFPKERVEVFAAGQVLQLDNFIKLKAYGWSGFKKMNLWRQDKGQKACAAAFVRAVEQGGRRRLKQKRFLRSAGLRWRQTGCCGGRWSVVSGQKAKGGSRRTEVPIQRAVTG